MRGSRGAHTQQRVVILSWCLLVRTRRITMAARMEAHTEKKGSMGKQLRERPPVYIVLSTISAEGAFILTD
jgi:hypothetical protein